MISLSYEGDDKFTLYGIRHFLGKSGLPIEFNPPKTGDISITYGNTRRGIFTISIKENEIQDIITGKIQAEREEVAIFEVPIDTGSEDQVFAWFHDTDTSYPCITLSEEGIVIGFDLLKEVGYLLSGHLDKLWPHLNEDQRDHIAQKPIIDFYEDLLVRSIRIGCHQLHIPLARKAYWPENKRFAVCLTHDVDEMKKTYQWITRPSKFLYVRNFHGLKNQLKSFLQKIKGKEPYWTFDDIIRIERDLGGISTFFFLKETAEAELLSPESWHHLGRTRNLENPRVREIIRTLSETGFEIGLHGSFNSYTNLEMLKQEKLELEEISGGKITGIRQHHLNLEVPLTWLYHQRAGLSYDTSLGYKERIGFRYGTCFPFHPMVNGNELKLIEIPLILMDITIPMNEDGLDACRKIIDEVEKHRGLLTLLWHPPVFNELEYPNAREIYQRIIESCKERGAWVTNAVEVFNWWSGREGSGFDVIQEDETLKFKADFLDSRQYIEVILPDHKQMKLDSNGATIVVGTDSSV